MNKKIFKIITALLLCVSIGFIGGNFLGENYKAKADVVVSPHEDETFFEEGFIENSSSSESSSESESN